VDGNENVLQNESDRIEKERALLSEINPAQVITRNFTLNGKQKGIINPAIPETIRTTGWQVGAVKALRFACSEMRQRYTYESGLQGSGTNALLKNNQPEELLREREKKET